MTTQIWQMGAAELAAAIREGRASAREVVAAHRALAAKQTASTSVKATMQSPGFAHSG